MSTTTPEPGTHYAPLIKAIPHWLGQTTSARRDALRSNRRPVSARIKAAPGAQRTALNDAIARHMTAQNALDQLLERVNSAPAFAEPLLKAALQARFNLDVNVSETFLLLYIPVKALGTVTGSRTWKVSLLDAALHNFEADETRADAYLRGSSFITRPSQTQQFQTLTQLNSTIGITAFTQLCRELDIGAAYKSYLEENLGISNRVVATILRRHVDTSQKAALRSALHLARMNGDIGPVYGHAIAALLDGSPPVRVNGQLMRCHDLTLLECELTGPVVFAPDLERQHTAASVVAYVPDDPEHPLKEYRSSTEMARELIRQLRTTEYQQFFSRFVAHGQRGIFYTRLKQRLSRMARVRAPIPDGEPIWQDTAIEAPHLQFTTTAFTDNLWNHLYQRKLDKILNDAATLAVPTATVDRNARWALWDSFVGIASSILQIGAMLIAPLVPFLGEMMMAYMVYQMLDDTFEAVVDWAEGQSVEAVEHFFSAVESLIQAGIFGVGINIAATELPKILPASVMNFLGRFLPVQARGGKTLYWKPDLKPYEQTTRPAAGSIPDNRGLYQVADKRLAVVDQACFAVSDHENAGLMYIDHPTRPDAYRPLLRHNGDGAFHTELERPQQWDRATVLQRIGHPVQPFTADQCERILDISGSSENALRKMHVNQERLPPLLADTLDRFRIDQDLQRITGQNASRQRQAMFEQRYRALQHRDDGWVAKVAPHTIDLPARLTEELLQTATGAELLRIEQGEWPERQQSLTQAARHEMRLARAYEGLELDSVNNPDTATLALHSLQRLNGWSTRTRLAVHEQHFDGKVIDSTGPIDASVQKVLARRTDGTWQPFDQQGRELYAPTDFFTCVLQALPDAGRRALGLNIGDGTKLRQAIRDNPLPRDSLRLTLEDTAVPTPARDTLRLLGMEGYPHNATADTATPTLANRVRDVFAGISEDGLQNMLNTLQDLPGDPVLELARLRSEYLQLESDLGQWLRTQVRFEHPGHETWSPAHDAAAVRDRQSFAQALLECWRRESLTLPGYSLHFSEPIMGELPHLQANFSHVASLEINGCDLHAGIDAFLSHFPGLARLNLQRFNLRSLPPVITTMPALRHLRLRQCNLVLTASDQSLLTSLTQLTRLDLERNPLGTPPDLRQLPELSTLNLSSTAISEVPVGLLHHPRITNAWLANNRITELSQPWFEPQSSANARYDFSDNPLSSASREKVKTLFQQAGRYLGIRAEPADITRIRALFPNLVDPLDSELLYSLSGSLAQGRLQLTAWETEIGTLTSDLSQWVRGRTAAGEEPALPEQHAREAFAGHLEQLWRYCSTQRPLQRANALRTFAAFTTDMPAVTANFSHIHELIVTGNENIGNAVTFFGNFPNLKKLELHHFSLAQLPQLLTRLPRLKFLTLNHCGIVLDADAQLALSRMSGLKSLNLAHNPLGHTPDFQTLPSLNHLDLSNTHISELPRGLVGHPALKTIILSDNRISELPGILFRQPATQGDSYDLSNNPFSAQTREQLKDYCRQTGQRYGVLADPADSELTRTLFPALNVQQASDVFFSLPGSLEHGRSLLLHWQAELRQMSADLAHWVNAVPDTHPLTEYRFNAQQKLDMQASREVFARDLESFWRSRSAEQPRQRTDALAMNLMFIGDLPALSTDFSHVRTLVLDGNPALTGIEPFLSLFPGLLRLDLHALDLQHLPAACARMPQLQRLIIKNCQVTLSPETRSRLSSLHRLEILSLSHNPLGSAPTLDELPELTHLGLINTGIREIPSQVIDHPRLINVLLDHNAIRELPEALYQRPANSFKLISVADNPLSDVARERIKSSYSLTRQDFGVTMPQTEIDRLRALFPVLDAVGANRTLYRLPGTLGEGLARLANWEMELSQLRLDIARWVDDIPERFPSSDNLLNDLQRTTERHNREQLGQSLIDAWQARSPDDPSRGTDTLDLDLDVIGELPAMNADFSHIKALSILGNPTLGASDGFLQAFNGLQILKLRQLDLRRIPTALERMPALEKLELIDCAITLDTQTRALLSSLTSLKVLDLYNNPLGLTPDIRPLGHLEFLDLGSCGIDEVPARVAELPNLAIVILSNNRITEIPAAVFERVKSLGDGYDLGNNPLTPATFEAIKAHYLRTGSDLGVLAPEADRARAQTLYPHLDDEQASTYLFRLGGTWDECRIELTRLEQELSHLIRDLARWTDDIPARAANGAPLNETARQAQQDARSRFAEALQTCWRKTPVEDMSVSEYGFTVEMTFTGDLPRLSVNLPHVTDMFLIGNGKQQRMGRFLEAFPNLGSLMMHDCDLGNLPDALFTMGSLTTLRLTDCNIRLTSESALALAGMDKLVLLNLSDNPLHLTPDLSNLQSLAILDLSKTGISEVPAGVLENFAWEEVDLSGNAITDLPDTLMEVPASVGESYDLHDNPLSEESQARVRAYYHETGETLGIHELLGTARPTDLRPDIPMEH